MTETAMFRSWCDLWSPTVCNAAAVDLKLFVPTPTMETKQ
jgi:hypothetical protein